MLETSIAGRCCFLPVKGPLRQSIAACSFSGPNSSTPRRRLSSRTLPFPKSACESGRPRRLRRREGEKRICDLAPGLEPVRFVKCRRAACPTAAPSSLASVSKRQLQDHEGLRGRRYGCNDRRPCSRGHEIHDRGDGREDDGSCGWRKPCQPRKAGLRP